MAIISPLPYNIVNGQAVDSTPVMADFNQIVNNVNANAAALAGSSSQVFNVAPATTSTEVPPLGQVTEDKVSIYGSSGTSLVGAAFTQVVLDTVQFDTNSLYNAANGITIKRAGYYIVHGQVSAPVVAANDQFLIEVLVNGASPTRGSRSQAAAANAVLGAHASALLYLNVGDIVTLAAYVTTSTTTESGAGGIFLQASGPIL